MRLDHLLSKELLTTGYRACMGAVVVVSVAHCAGVCSAVGAHGWNINESNLFWHGLHRLCPGASTAASCPFGGVVLSGKLPGRGLCGVVFGALLGPEATGPFCSNAEGIVWCFFCSCFRFPRSPCQPPSFGWGLWWVVVWLMGLLFENYIVDASI